MAKRQKISHARLMELLHYEPDTGLFWWKVTRSNNYGRAGDLAGNLDPVGYRKIRVDGSGYWAHALAWFYMKKRWPRQIDHRNGIKDDNRIDNLRLATHSQNLGNAKKPRTNTSGYKGASRSRHNRRWHAQITVERIHYHLGYFDTPEQAHAAYCAAALQMRGEFARLS